jgi:hypothetical protein
MTHLTVILDRMKQASRDFLDAYADTRAVGEAVETWTETHPNYNAMMAKQDETVEFINDFYSDLQGKISDMETLAGV